MGLLFKSSTLYLRTKIKIINSSKVLYALSLEDFKSLYCSSSKTITDLVIK